MQWLREAEGFDEIFEAKDRPRPHYAELVATLGALDPKEIARREKLIQLSLLNQGITFAVYGEDEGVERIFPFDFVPRIIPADEWKQIEDGLVQRVTALNLFLSDVYGEQRCLHEGIVPWELVLTRKEFKRELLGVSPPREGLHPRGRDRSDPQRAR